MWRKNGPFIFLRSKHEPRVLRLKIGKKIRVDDAVGFLQRDRIVWYFTRFKLAEKDEFNFIRIIKIPRAANFNFLLVQSCALSLIFHDSFIFISTVLIRRCI